MGPDRFFLTGVLWILALLPAPDAQELPKAAGKLTIMGRPTITIKPLCNPDGKGETNIRVRNAGSEAVTPDLMPGDVISRTPAKTLANVKFELPKLEPLAANQTADLHVIVRNVFEQGDFEASFQNAGVDAGTLRIVRSNPPFSISVDTANPADPELSFTRGKTAHFRLRNADPRGYRIDWVYSVDGKTVRSDRPIDILAEGETEITFTPPKDWFWGRFTSLFKDKTADGYLTVLRIEADPECGGQAAASRNIKIKTHLAGWNAGIAKELLADITVFILLALGGFLSLMLNSALPNQMRRVKLKESLNTIGAEIKGLSYALASRLRVMVGVELRLMRDKLRDLSWTNPDFSTDIDNLDADVKRLETRLQVLGALGATRVNYQKMRAQGLPPSLMLAMEQTFDRIVEIGKKSDPTDTDVQTAQSLIKGIQDQLDAGVQVTPAAVAAMAQRIQSFKQVFGPQGQLGATGTFRDVKSKLPGPFADLSTIDESKLTADTVLADDSVKYDRLLFKLDKLQRYIHLVEGLPDTTGGFRSQVVRRQDMLVDFLGKESWDAMYDSYLLLREMEGGIFPEALEDEITAGLIRVDFDPQTIRPYQPIQFSLLFAKMALNDAPAREAWTCCWTFSRNQEEEALSESGWMVTHYFQKPAPYLVKINLTHNRSGKVVAVPDVERLQKGQVYVSPIPRRSWGRVLQLLFQLKFGEARIEWMKSRTGAGRRLEWLRLLLALFVALIGLLAGAKEQLLKLDVLPALLAIFLIGFGADQVKNLLTRRPSETGTNTAH
jgi:hypothetical protein